MKSVVFLVIAGALAVGAVLYGLFGTSSSKTQPVLDDTNPVTEVDETEENQVPLSGVGSLEALKLFGQNLECTISYDSPDVAEPIVGTYFVSGDSIRGDFEMTIPELGGEMVSSIIWNDGMMYSWSDIGGQKYGMKVNTATLEAGEQSEAVREPIPSDVNVRYNCQVWTAVDGSVFVPPSDVLFQDFSAVLETGMEYGTVYNEEN